MRSILSVPISAALAASALAVAFPVPAAATGGIGCIVEDSRLVLHLEGSFSHGTGGALVHAGGTAEVRLAGTPATLRTSPLERGHVTQYWLSGKELKLVVYRETDAGSHGSIEITIKTRRASKDETIYAGSYQLRVETMEGVTGSEAHRLEARGKVSCSVG